MIRKEQNYTIEGYELILNLFHNELTIKLTNRSKVEAFQSIIKDEDSDSKINLAESIYNLMIACFQRNDLSIKLLPDEKRVQLSLAPIALNGSLVLYLNYINEESRTNNSKPNNCFEGVPEKEKELLTQKMNRPEKIQRTCTIENNRVRMEREQGFDS